MVDTDATASKAGIHLGDDQSVLHQGPEQAVLVGGVARQRSSLPKLQCQICYETSDGYSALGCGHAFCNPCYAQYVGHKIADEGHECVYARCPELKCSLVLSDALVRSLLPLLASDDAGGGAGGSGGGASGGGGASTSAEAEGRGAMLVRRWENATSLGRSFVDDQPGLKWCPAPDCAHAVRAPASTRGVTCDCGHRFCFSCLHEDHAPCSYDARGHTQRTLPTPWSRLPSQRTADPVHRVRHRCRCDSARDCL